MSEGSKLAVHHMTPKHPLEVRGYEGEMQALAEQILRMRYDKVVEFLRFFAIELYRQSHGDKLRSRTQLAGLLAQAGGIATEMQKNLQAISDLCEPHFDKE